MKSPRAAAFFLGLNYQKDTFAGLIKEAPIEPKCSSRLSLCPCSVVLVVSGCQRTQGLSAALCETRSIAKEAYTYGFPLVHWSTTAGSSKPIFVDIGNPEYKGSWKWSTTPRVCTPPKTKRYRPQNSDTPDFEGYFEREADSPKLLEIVERSGRGLVLAKQ